MAGKPISPMAYRIKPNQVRKIYYLGFPSSWKEELIKITKDNNPKFKSEYGLSTHALQKLVDSWMEGIVSMSPLKEYSDDSQWLASTMPFDEKRINILFEIIRVWVMLFLCYCFCLLPLFGLGRLFGILYRLLPASFCWAGVGPRFRYTANMANMLAIAVDLWPFSLYALWQSLCPMPDLRRISPCFFLVF